MMLIINVTMRFMITMNRMMIRIKIGSNGIFVNLVFHLCSLFLDSLIICFAKEGEHKMLISINEKNTSKRRFIKMFFFSAAHFQFDGKFGFAVQHQIKGVFFSCVYFQVVFRFRCTVYCTICILHHLYKYMVQWSPLNDRSRLITLNVLPKKVDIR